MSRDTAAPMALALLAALAMHLILTTKTAHAQPSKFAPRMTGQMLVDQFLGPASMKGQNLTGRTLAEHKIAKGYLDGINDATEGALWCYTGNWKPHTLDYNVVFALKYLPKGSLEGNAAPLVLDYLQKQFPCKNSK